MRLYPSGQAARTWRTGDDCWIVRGKVVRRGKVESVKSGDADVRLAGKSGTATVLVREMYWSHHAAKMAYLQAALGADPKPAPVVAVSAVSAEDAAEARRHERERVASLAYAWLLGKLDVDTRLQLHTVLRSASPEAPKGYAIEPAVAMLMRSRP